ncbi:MAG: SDR family oxidoreductase [Kordiimonadaceae bacterium]|nr:SDR family oxidoreductase [Kordiimonadaceae bacterium]MBO6568734.1 SDR family oxidoreductase [Kordiimonadaceae bacterium]MBO6965290.1 SDR family oxidoreductase [Kordiimonadaceae bacterium]
MFDLTGKVALVTGGNGGIGLAFAKGLLKAGAKVAIWGRNESKNEAALKELAALDGDAAAFVCDVTNTDSVATAFAETMERFGQIDSCFANAGGSGARGLLHELSADDWSAVVDLNLTSVVNTYQPVIKQLIERGAPGKLVVTSSIAAHLGIGNGAGYSATKAAVSGLTRALAVELGRSNIQVNAVLPGFIETEMSLKTPQYFQDSARRRTASGVIGTLEDMEGIAVFLASSESNYITGQEIIIDGGQSIFPM